MTIVPPKNRLLEQQIPIEGGVLCAKLMAPKPPVRPQRVVFISPLVGAGAAQPLLIFRNLTRRGSILLSFEYRGHGRSTGRFELDATLSDVHHALIWAWNYANGRGLSLHGFATCYGTVSLLAQFKENGCGCLLKSLSTVSGLFRMDQILRFDDFAPIASRHLGQKLALAELVDGLAQQKFDWSGNALRYALFEYLTGLFPQLRVGHDYFEELRYERVSIPETLLQLSRARYLDGVTVPPEIPCHVFAGRNDDTLSLRTPEGREAYRKQVLSLIPHAVLHEHEFDHFGRGVEHDAVIEQLADIFEEYDTSSAVPRPHLNPTAWPVGGLR
ncbi:MAG: alpha/beta hydrolase family protein [Pirellulales bacterium]